MSDHLLQRAQILMHQRKHDEAGKVLMQLLATDPNDIYVLAMLSEVKISQDDYKEAEMLVNSAISLSPDTDFLYQIKARVAIGRDYYDDAETALQQAVSINPYNAHSFALWAAVKLDRKKFQDALDHADHSLSIDPENILALNSRSTALLKLNKKEEAFKTIEGALREDPENAYTHANYGWGLLEKGETKQSLKHFREALRHDPTMVYAQQGMLQALKARYLFYRLFLRYSFWMGNLHSKFQWGVIIGFYLLTRLLEFTSGKYPALQPFLIPVIALLAAFAISTWLITPISNLFLRLNSFGRHLLTRESVLSSNFVGISLVICIAGGIIALITSNYSWLAVCAFGFAMMIPCSVMFMPSKYNSLLIYAGVMCIVGLVAIYTTFLTKEIFNNASVAFLVGLVAFQWIANFMMIRRDNR